MAHALSILENGKAEMMFTGKRPWHGLGTELDHPATAKEAIEAAGLDWRIEEVPVEVFGSALKGWKALSRSDNGKVLHLAKDRYTPLQNVVAFRLFDEVVGSGQAVYHTAGALDEGRKVWILAKLPGEMRIAGTDDVTEKFLLLLNSHDGSSALRMLSTPVRVVCQNTLIAALKDGDRGFSGRHTRGLPERVHDAQAVLGIAHRHFDRFEERANHLAIVPVRNRDLLRFADRLFPTPKEEPRRDRVQQARNEVLRLFEEGAGNALPGVRGSWWAVYNAATDYSDHVRTTRGASEGERSENRLSSIWFGGGAELKSRAWDLALEGSGIPLN